MDQRQFREEVLPRELEEVRARRETLGLACAPLDVEDPHAGELVGLALSGGGIRSSTFCLGAVQALAHGGVLEQVDYLSTVSGGGFIGGCLSSSLNHEKVSPRAGEFPLEENVGGPESGEISQLRHSAKYLAPSGFLEKLRIPALLVRGMLINLVLIFPFIVLAVLATEVWAEYLSNGEQVLLDVIEYSTLAFLVLGIIPPYLSYFFVRRFNWRARLRYEYTFVFFLVVALAGLIIYPLSLLIEYFIDISWGRLMYQTLSDLSLAGDSGFFWAVVALSVCLLGLAGRASQNLAKARNRLLLYMVSFLGPGLIFFTYALLCVWQVDSPFIHLDARYYLSQDEIDSLRQGDFPEKLRSEMTGEDQPLGTAGSGQVTLSVVDGKDRWQVTDGMHTYGVSITQRVATVEDQWLVPQMNEQKMSGALLGLLRHKGVEALAGDQIKRNTDGGWDITVGSGASDMSYHISSPVDDRMKLTPQPRDVWDHGDEYFYGGALLVLLLNWIFVNVNFTSLHGFFRDQLTRGFLIRSGPEGLSEAGVRMKLSELNRAGTAAPYHLLNVTLNLHGSDDTRLRGRGADFFLMSKHFVGGERTGYVPTEAMERVDSHLDLGTAMAISGAAASPNAGSVAIRSLVFVLTMLNLRLDYWLPNPSYVSRANRLSRFLLRRGAGPWYVFREALGRLQASTVFVNLSDGGHLENTGVYQLLRRRCQTIICVDGEEDASLRFGGLVKLIRLAVIDLGVRINIDTAEIKRQEQGLSAAHFAVGEIDYGNGQFGKLYYLKASLSGDENPYIMEYRERNPSFPHESTAGQFFSEDQFEAYRALGKHIARQALETYPEIRKSVS